MKAFIEETEPRREGLLLRARLEEVDEPLPKMGGDLERWKGEEMDANASKPVLFTPEEVEDSFGELEKIELVPFILVNGDAADVAKDGVGEKVFPLLVLATGVGEGECLCPKTDGPLAEPKGEVVEA